MSSSPVFRITSATHMAAGISHPGSTCWHTRRSERSQAVEIARPSEDFSVRWVTDLGVEIDTQAGRHGQVADFLAPFWRLEPSDLAF